MPSDNLSLIAIAVDHAKYLVGRDFARWTNMHNAPQMQGYCW
jgi:hypothetical protein